MGFILNLIKGIAIGAGGIIPGVSSGVICVIFGIYEKLIESFLGLFKEFNKNFKFLFPISVGAIIGMILFGKILNHLLNNYPVQVSFTFIGLIIGSIPALLKNINNKEKFKISNLIYFIVALIIGFAMVMLERNIPNTIENENFSFIYLFVAGLCMSAGVVVPGVSSTVILMLFGVYGCYLNSISNMYLSVLIPIFSGLLIGSIFCMKIIKYLFNNFYVQTFYSIIGFTLGSIFVLYPGISFDIQGIVSILCIFIGAVASSLFT